ncbi:protein DOG1-like 4 [Triticum dicoccoides]|uniref:protein DOG1-like 4 n=1 Tax=Triticum dicoccoides TaxID=85692 RepID=UPI00162D6858|nr:protein DOG1-like 4 [Triticum dicoccoides]
MPALPRPARCRRRRTHEHTSYMAHAGEMASFYDAWVGREEEMVSDLTAALGARRRDALAPLVDAAMDHVAAYYEHKASLADRDVVAALDQRWLNPLERTFLWAWGWRPALVFRFVDGSGAVGPRQRRELEDLRAATAAAEKEVDREVAAVQESLAGPRVLEALRQRRQHPRNGVQADEAVAAVGRSLRVLLAAGDALRERTVRGVVGVLAPDAEQAGAFVAAMLRFHLGVHRAGRAWSSSGHGGGRRGL